MTFDSPEIIIEMLQNDGVYPGDPQAYTIWEYKNQHGKVVYAVFMTEDHDMFLSPYVFEPKLLWEKREGLTKMGRLLLNK